jgi:peptide chain release factor 1
MDEVLRNRLRKAEREYEGALARLADPEVLADQARYREASARHADLKPLVDALRRSEAAEREIAVATELMASESDHEMLVYLATTVEERRAEIDSAEAELLRLLIPKDPNDDKDVIVEIRAAAGGDEAALWAADLHRMYERFAERHGWGTEPITFAPSEGGGLKDATFAIKGKGAYSRFRFEAGPHRVQRVPRTESQGRIHTSVATVAVLPEAKDVDVAINENDLQIETFRSSGPGGQSVNTTDSAIRITHLPSGLVVSCQDEKSQLQNKAKAMRVLRARLYQLELQEQLGERDTVRRSQVGTGERAEKIRTYNFKESRVTDHRIGLTVHSLPAVLDGDLDELHEALIADEAAWALADEP